VDELLYTVDVAARLPETSCPVPVRIERFDADAPSGDPSIDRRLDGLRACFVAHVDGQVAHRSWLHHDTLLPSLFGFAAAPVIGDCATDPAFRGLRLYPHVLTHIVADVRARALADAVHVLVASDNTASIRGIERAGFSLIGHLRGVRVGPVVLRRQVATTRTQPVSP
jgi:hypothetical protein